ncbi:MAG: YidC/Oxa1 family membrane protein insertase [Candidatus Yanofskybacteria bacterium]|nr:YidC/Oxa1 family membrane protein insertase [Candidatus Yanofskybacteria bacterium]
MSQLFHTILTQPLFNLLIFLYNTLGTDLGIAIIVLTLVIRLIFSPLSIKASRSQQALAKLGPKVEEIKNKHKNDQLAQNNAVMQLYRDNKINPLAGCLPLLLQIPIILALYRMLVASFKPESLGMLYGFIKSPGVINTTSFGFLNIAVRNPWLAVVAGISQFIQAKLSAASTPTSGPGSNFTAAMSTQMLYFFPVMITIISWNLPAGLTLYWITTTVYSIFEQLYIRRTKAA